MPPTLATDHVAHSVRAQALMDAQHKIEIGERIKELRDNSPETNRSIAEYVGVGERSAAEWMAGGGITYDHAKKVAELFGVDVDYIWRGPRGETPDLMGALSTGGADVSERLAEIDRLVREAVAQNMATQNALLAGLAEVRTAQAEILSRLAMIERRAGGSDNG